MGELGAGAQLVELAARCPGEPLPTDANDSVPGLALARAVSSATVLGGNCGLATRICGSDATVPIGSKSFTVLKGASGRSPG
jgi:hypothetical protein